MTYTAPDPALSCDEVLFQRSRDRSDHVAVICAQGALTYRQLDRRVTMLAKRLQERGCWPGDRLALLLDPGQATVIAMLAALRAGLVYVPIEPAWPELRRQSILDETRARLVLMDAHSRVTPPAATDVLRHDFTLDSPRRFDRPACPGHLPAYILFTSGSTGKPKGIVQSRCGMAGHAAHYARSIALAPGERISLLAQYSCDAAVMDIFGAIHAGACLCIFDPRGANAGFLAAWLGDMQIAVCHMTPTLYRIAFRAKAPSGPPKLRCIVLGGEAVFDSDARRHYSLFPKGVELINGYGPTECTLALQQRVLATTATPDGKVPVGRPFAGISVSLVDGQQRNVPVGTVGEIILSGANVALGYWPLDPLRPGGFSAGPGDAERLFSTGDLALQQADGSYIHLGRADDQIKIAGHRVELGDIEATVLGLPGIGSAAVVAIGRAAGLRIGCCYVPAGANSPDEAMLRQALGARLPSHMVPALMVPVPALPLLTSGKIDRQALSALLEGHSPAPVVEGSLEDRVAAIWSQVLGTESPSRHDNFFSMGGDSLQAIQIELQIEGQMSVASPSLFHFPSIAQMAAALAQTNCRQGGLAIPPAALAGRRLPPPLQRYWARWQHAPDSPELNIGIVIEIDDALDLPLFMHALASVIGRNDVFSLCIEEGNEGPALLCVGGQASDPPVVYAQPGLSDRAWKELLERMAREQLARPFDLRKPGLYRAELLKRGARSHALLMTFHHLIIDAWARRLFERELAEAYRALSVDPCWQGTQRPRYSDATFASAESLDNAALERLARPYRMPPMALPYHPAPQPEGVGETQSHLDAAATGALDRFARDRGVSRFAVLASLCGLTLAWWCGSSYAVVTVDRLNRRARDLETIGLFADVAPLLFEWTPELPFAKLARHTQQEVGLINGANAPFFAEMMERLQPGKLRSYNALFPIALALEETPPMCSKKSGLNFQSREIAAGQISRDMIFVLSPDARGCAVTLLYRAARFNAQAPRRLLQGLVSMAQSLADSAQAGPPDISCGELLARCPSGSL